MKKHHKLMKSIASNCPQKAIEVIAKRTDLPTKFFTVQETEKTYIVTNKFYKDPEKKQEKTSSQQEKTNKNN